MHIYTTLFTIAYSYHSFHICTHQVIGLLGAGGLAGNSFASRINITDLPQMVAAFHSLVGLAAAITSIANVMMMVESGHSLDGVHAVTALLGDVIGAITLTGSVSMAEARQLMHSR